MPFVLFLITAFFKYRGTQCRNEEPGRSDERPEFYVTHGKTEFYDTHGSALCKVSKWPVL